ncbi:MAG: DUF2752 domain-containing protein [Bifidobacteriaceae bacterium]|nr:DUF2752 domain-containing protein [Bifidobacteriaceae bacterium]
MRHHTHKDFLVVICFLVAILTFGWYCPFYYITGVPCPGCFATRSLLSLFQFDISKAFYYSAVIPFLPLFGAAMIIFYIKDNKKACRIVFYIFATILVGYWIYRLIFCFGTEPFVYNYNSLFIMMFF